MTNTEPEVNSSLVQINDFHAHLDMPIAFDGSVLHSATPYHEKMQQTPSDAVWGIWITGDAVTLLAAFVGLLYPRQDYPRWLICLLGYASVVHLSVTVLCAQVFDLSKSSYILVLGLLIGTLLFLMCFFPLICLCGDLPILSTIISLFIAVLCPLLMIMCITEITRTDSEPDFQTFVYLDRELPEWPAIWVCAIPLRFVPIFIKRQIYKSS